MTQQNYPTPDYAGPNTDKPSSMKWVIIGIVAAVVIIGGILLGFLVSRTTVVQVPTTQAGPAKPTPVVLPGPAMEAGAADMVSKYTADAAVADTEYRDKTIDVTGAVFGTPTDLSGERAVALEGGTEKFRGVRCVFPAANYFQIDELEKGQTVTIRGRCTGLESDIILKDCAVLKVQ